MPSRKNLPTRDKSPEYLPCNTADAPFDRSDGEMQELRTQLQQHEDRLRHIIQHIDIGYCYLDLTGRCQYVNRAFLEMHHAANEQDILGQPLETFIAKEDRNRMRRCLQRANKGESIHGQSFRRINSDGSEAYGIYSSLPFRAGQDIEGVECFLRDMPEQDIAKQRQEDARQQMERYRRLESLSVLAGGVAHDFNNLLVGILGNAELVRNPVSETSPVRDMIEDICVSAHRAAELTARMLDYSGHGRYMLNRLDLRTFVRSFEEKCRSALPTEVSLTLELQEDTPPIEADAAQLGRALRAALDNAIEALEPAGGTISIATGHVQADSIYLASTYVDDHLAPGTYAWLDIADNGPGMDAEELSQAFDPFYTTRLAGRGLGLPSLLGVIRAHHGAVELTSKPGKGTRLRILLPASA